MRFKGKIKPLGVRASACPDDTIFRQHPHARRRKDCLLELPLREKKLVSERTEEARVQVQANHNHPS